MNAFITERPEQAPAAAVPPELGPRWAAVAAHDDRAQGAATQIRFAVGACSLGAILVARSDKPPLSGPGEMLVQQGHGRLM